MEYRNLDLEAFDYEAADDVERFRVRVTGSPVGEHLHSEAEEVTVPPDLRTRLRRLERRAPDLPGMIALGEDLAGLLFPPRAREFLILSREGLDADEGLRIRLKVHAYALADLPWEYAYVAQPNTPPGQKGFDGFLVLDRRVSLVRYEVMGQPPRSLDPVGAGPLRLVALLASPGGSRYPPLGLDLERRNIEQALEGVTQISAEFYPDATVETLEDALTREAHVFHFAGHGECKGDLGVALKSLEGTSHLVLLDERGGAYLFPAEKLAQNLRGGGVRLAVLGACEGGRRDQVNAWIGVVTALTRAGIPAVVGMQYTIRDQNAIAFSQRFYRALAAGQPIDAAVSDGRLAIFNRSSDDERDWGVPVLYLHADTGVLFPKPDQPRVWLYMADGEDARQMDLLERQDRVLWGANRRTRAGDVVLMYRTAPYSDLAYLFRAASDAREAEQTVTWRWDYAVDLGEKVTLERPLPLAEIRAHPDLADWSLARTPQGAMRHRTDIREEGYWEALRSLLVARNPALIGSLARWGDLEQDSHPIGQSEAEALAKMARSLAQAGKFDLALWTANEIQDECFRACALIWTAQELARAGEQARAVQVVVSALRNVEAVKEAARASVLDEAGEALGLARGFELAVRQAETIEEEETRARTLTGVAQALASAGQQERAAEAAYRALQAVEAIEGETARAIALSRVARALAQAGERERGTQAVDRALQVAEGIKDESSRSAARSEVAQAVAKIGLGQEAALDWFLARVQVIQDETIQAETMARIIWALVDMGEADLARALSDASGAAFLGSVRDTLGLLSGETVLEAPETETAAPSEMAQARLALWLSVEKTLDLVLEWTSALGQQILGRLVDLSEDELAAVVKSMGGDIVQAYGPTEGESSPLSRELDAALQRLVSALGRTDVRAASQTILDLVGRLRQGERLDQHLAALYGIERTKADLDRLATASQASLEQFSAAIEGVESVGAAYRQLIELCERLDQGLGFLAFVPAAALPQAERLRTTSYLALGTYIVLAGASYADAPELGLAERPAGVRSVVEEALTLPIDFLASLRERTPDFVGREWVLAEIDHWLADPDAPRYFVVIGEPGSGITALSVRLSLISAGEVLPPEDTSRLRPGFLSAVHFCWVGKRMWISPYTFVKSLAAQLSARYPAYATALLERKADQEVPIKVAQVPADQRSATADQRLDVSALSAEDAFVRLVREPLQALYAAGFEEPIVILVNDLGEALQYPGTVNIVQLLAKSTDLPLQVRFVLTSSPGQYLGVFDDTQTQSLDRAESMDDIRLYVRTRLDASDILRERVRDWGVADDALVDTLAEASEGNFGYVRHLLADLESGSMGLQDVRRRPVAWQDRLSPSYEAALLWAEGLRRATGEDEICTKYLLIGLYQERGGPTYNLLTLFDDDTALRPALEDLARQGDVFGRAQRTYVVRAGDTLAQIAARMYGDATLYTVIAEHNGITPPGFIRAGQRLIIPPRGVSLDGVRPASAGDLEAFPLSPNVEKAVQASVALADRKGSPTLHSRHLLAGLLSLPQDVASEWVADRLQVKRETLYALIEQTPDAAPPLDEIRRASARSRPAPRTYLLGLRGMQGDTPVQEISVADVFDLHVDLVPVAPGTEGAIAMPPELDVLYGFVSADGLGVQGDDVGMLRLRGGDDRLKMQFRLQADLIGRRTCRVEFFGEDPRSGRAHPLFEDSPPEYSIRVRPPRAGEERPPVLPALNVRLAPQPALVLQVQANLVEERVAGRPEMYRLVYYLTSRLPLAGQRLRNARIGQLELSSVELERLQALVNVTLAQASGQPEDVRARLVSLGTYLYRRLFPEDSAARFREALLELSQGDAGQSLQQAGGHRLTCLIVEDALPPLWMPWELLVPHGEGDEGPFRFLGEQLYLSRWVQGLGPPLYGEIPVSQVALVTREPGADEWRRLFGTGAPERDFHRVLDPETPLFAAHLVRRADSLLTRRDIVPWEGQPTDGTGQDQEDEEAAQQGRPELRRKRPVIGLGMVRSDGPLPAASAGRWLLPARVLPYLRAGASAVIVPWWATSVDADRIFWPSFYDLIHRYHVSLGEAVWRARQEVRHALPDRPDWLAYTLFGDPRARPYVPQLSEGYTALECLDPERDGTLRPGKAYQFRVSISTRPPVWHEGRLVLTEALPKQPRAVFMIPDWQETIPDPVPLAPDGRFEVQATAMFVPPEEGRFVLTVRLLDGDEHLQSLQIRVRVQAAGS